MSRITINANDRKKIKELLSKSEDQLYASLPLFIPEHRGKFFSPQKQVEVGKKEFQKLQDNIHQIICVQWKLCKKINTPEWNDSVVLVAGIADAITALLSGLVPAFTIGALIVKIGARKFCNCSEQK